MKQSTQNSIEDILAHLEQSTSETNLQDSICELKQYVDFQKRLDAASKKVAIAFIVSLAAILISLAFCLNSWLNLRSDLMVASGSTSPDAIIEKCDSLQRELTDTQLRFVNFANSAKNSAPIDIDFETWTCRPNAEWELAKKVLTDKDGYMIQLITLEDGHTVTYPELIEECDSLRGLVNDAIMNGYRPMQQKKVVLKD